LRARLGGMVWIAARKDDVVLLHDEHVHRLRDDGLRGAPWAKKWNGGPRSWAWHIERCLAGSTWTLDELMHAY
jgi:hypothetical protein